MVVVGGQRSSPQSYSLTHPLHPGMCMPPSLPIVNTVLKVQENIFHVYIGYLFMHNKFVKANLFD